MFGWYYIKCVSPSYLSCRKLLKPMNVTLMIVMKRKNGLINTRIVNMMIVKCILASMRRFTTYLTGNGKMVSNIIMLSVYVVTVY